MSPQHEAALRAAILEHGITPPETIIPDGKLRRFATNGHRGDDAGWIIAWNDAAVFGDWRRGDDPIYWSAKPTAAEQEARRRRIEDAHRQTEEDRQRRATQAAALAAEVWKVARPAGVDHPYLVRKAIKPVPALRETSAQELARRLGYAPAAKGEPLQGRVLLAPVKVGGKLSTLEMIDEQGRKSALAGGIKKGGFWATGPLPAAGGEVVIAEGVATALSIYEATGKVVVAALSVGNLRPVCEAMKASGLQPSIAADLSKDTGKPHPTAVEAANACAVLLTAPPADILPGTDFNDLHAARGLDAVRQAFQPAPLVELLNAAEVKPEPVRWLWDGWLARGKFHILAGKPGTGKTTLALGLAATVTAAGRWPDGAHCPNASNVVIWSGEDDVADTLVPRLMAAGADMKRVHFVNCVNDAKGPRSFDPAVDVPLLAQAISNLRPALFILDPVISAVAGDSHKNAETRRALQPIVELAANVGCAVLGITHLAKGTAGRDPLERVTGSVAFGALARVVLLAFKRENVPPGEVARLLARAKSNLGPDDGAVGYELEHAEATTGIWASRIVWTGTVEGTASDLMAQAEAVPDEEDDEIAHAKRFLVDLLSDGPLPSKQVEEDAKGAGFSWATIRRAAKAIGVKPRKEGGAFGGRGAAWKWHLPQVAQIPTSCSRKNGEHLVGGMSKLCEDEAEERL